REGDLATPTPPDFSSPLPHDLSPPPPSDLSGLDFALVPGDFATAPGDLGGVVTSAPSFGIDPAHTNSQPLDVVPSPLTKRWSVNLGGNASYPLIVDDRVFVAAAASQPNLRPLDR